MTVSSAIFPRRRVLEIADGPEDPTSCIAEPIDYEELEPLLVPPGDRQLPKYCGIYLLILDTCELRVA